MHIHFFSGLSLVCQQARCNKNKCNFTLNLAEADLPLTFTYRCTCTYFKRYVGLDCLDRGMTTITTSKVFNI